MTMKTIRLELARSKEHPAGDSAHSYVFRAPIDETGRINIAAWRKLQNLCTVHRYERGYDVEEGVIEHVGGDRWVFSYAPGAEDDEPIYRMSEHRFAPGEYVSIIEHDGVERTFRVAFVENWHPRPMNDATIAAVTARYL